MRDVCVRLSMERRVQSPISIGPYGAGEPTAQPNPSLIPSVVRQTLPLGYPFSQFFFLFSEQPSFFRHLSFPKPYARVIKRLKSQILPPNISDTQPFQTRLQSTGKLNACCPKALIA